MSVVQSPKAHPEARLGFNIGRPGVAIPVALGLVARHEDKLDRGAARVWLRPLFTHAQARLQAAHAQGGNVTRG